MKLNASAAYFRLHTVSPFHREMVQLTRLKFWARKMNAVSHLEGMIFSMGLPWYIQQRTNSQVREHHVGKVQRQYVPSSGSGNAASPSGQGERDRS